MWSGKLRWFRVLGQMWLDIAIALSFAVGGIICGWIMHAIGGCGNNELLKQVAAGECDLQSQNDYDREQISEVADRLRGYAIKMAADVDAHQTRVQEVNNSLNDENTGSPKAVFSAVNQLIEANEAMQRQLHLAQDRIHDQAVQIESAELRAQTDALTQVPNRGAFDSHLAQQFDMGAGKAGTLALLDVDHFKQFNDVYGHRAGDEVLRMVAKTLHARLHPYGLVARFGGEEFAVIMDGCSVQEAKDLVESARIAIGQRDIRFEDKRLRVAASAGIAELMDGEPKENWLQRADDAMYRSKDAGRNCGHWMDGHRAVRIGRAAETLAPAEEQLSDSPAAPESTLVAPSDAEAADQARGDVLDDPGASNKKIDPGAFAYLPDSQSLGDAFAEIRRRAKSTSMYVMSVHRGGHPGKTAMRSLLQIVRATMRSIDRIGCSNDSTLLVCMPSIDEATAFERGCQICRSADAIQLGGADAEECRVSVGLSKAETDDPFEEVVQRVTELSALAQSEKVQPVRVHGQKVTV